jgi:hypothetical protein
MYLILQTICVDDQSNVSEKKILFSNHQEFVFLGAYFFFITNHLLYLNKPIFSFIFGNCCIKCAEIIRFDAANFRRNVVTLYFPKLL